ncbi:MAG: carboxypeptidase regulatory-like domain-containing protein, partial [Bryobacteraceae bacterium]
MRWWTLSLSIALLAAIPAYSQRITASLGGTVHDPSGSAVPGAQVRIANAGTAAVISLKTDQNGHFLAPSLPPGAYSVSIMASGFKRLDRTGVVLQVDQTAEMNFSLELGSTTESVEVSGAPPVLDTATAELGQVVDNKSIVNLPLNQRNPFSLILLAPGVTGSVGTSFTGLQFNVNGGRSGTTDVLLDGVPSAPPTDSFNSLTVFPSVDAVQEFKVQTGSYSSEFGMSGGGIINVIYKSGTNDYHGSVYEFLRNSVMDANNFFSNRQGAPLASFKRNQFGFSLGGPILIPKVYNGKNKTFFFASYESLRQRAASTLLTTVPTEAERKGDFSRDTTSGGAPITIYDPLSTTLVGSTYTRQPFAGNTIPANRIDPVAANVRNYFPLPNTTGTNGSQSNNYYASGAAPYDIDQFDIKGDQIVSDRQRMSIRFSERNPTTAPAALFPAAIAFARTGSTGTQNAISGAFDYTLSATPTYLLEFRYGISRVVFHTSTLADGFNPVTLGFPAYMANDVNFLTMPGFEPAGYTGIGQGSQLAVGNLGIVSHSWALANTKVFSRHTLKFGAEARLLINDTDQKGRATGDFSFGTNFTQGPNALSSSSTAGDGFASLMLGLGSGTLTHNFKIIDTNSRYWAGYLQDDWKVTDKLTLNLGMRYELFLPRTERHDRQNFMDLTIASPLAGPSGVADLTGGLVYVGVNGEPRTQVDTNYKNFAPRFGFAYRAMKSTVVRGGYGIFYATQPSEAAATVGATGFRTDTPYLGTLDSVTPNDYLSDPFPGDVFLPVTGSALGLLTNVGQTISAPLRSSPSTYMQNWNLGIQRQLPGSWVVDVSYVGSRGVDLIWNPSFNQLPVEDLRLGSQLLQNVNNPFYGLITSSGPLSGKQAQLRYLLAPYPQFTGVAWGYQPGASSNYNSVQIRVEKRFSHDLGAIVSFTGSKLMDDASSNNTGNFNGSGTSQDANNRRGDYSLSTIDVSRRLVASFVYSLPFGHRKRFGSNWNRFTDATLGGWQINGIASFQNGVPLALSASNVANIFNPGERPNNNGQSAALSGSVESRLNQYFNTSVFSQPATYTLGNVSRTLPDVRTPGLRNFDISLFKNFILTERFML